MYYLLGVGDRKTCDVVVLAIFLKVMSDTDIAIVLLHDKNNIITWRQIVFVYIRTNVHVRKQLKFLTRDYILEPRIID